MVNEAQLAQRLDQHACARLGGGRSAQGQPRLSGGDAHASWMNPLLEANSDCLGYGEVAPGAGGCYLAGPRLAQVGVGLADDGAWSSH